MNEQRSTWSAGKITTLAGGAIAFIAMFMPWSISVWQKSLGEQDLGALDLGVLGSVSLGSVSLGSVSIKETINGWGYMTQEAGMLSKSGWFSNDYAIVIGIWGILSLIFLLVPIFFAVIKKDLKSKKSFVISLVFPIITFISSIILLIIISSEIGRAGIGIILFILSAIVVIVGIIISRRKQSIGA